MATRHLATVLLASATALGALVPASVPAQDQLTVVSWGGSFQEKQREAFFVPYMKETGAKLTEDNWGGEIAKVRAMVETDNVTWDVIVADYAHAVIGCEDGFLEEIDWAQMGDESDWLPGTVHPCGVSSDVFSLMFAYRSDVFTGDAPKTLEDVFDVERFPGRRGFRKNPKWMLEQVLMADGVPPEQVYELLDSPGGMDRALAKLDSIREHIIFWETNAQAPQLLADKEVAITEIFNGRMYNHVVEERQPFVAIWDGQVYAPNTWIVPKGANKEAAMRLLAWVVKPKRLATFASLMPYAPARLSAIEHVDAGMVPHLPTAPENYKRALGSDEQWWASHEEEIAERFTVWLAQ